MVSYMKTGLRFIWALAALPCTLLILAGAAHGQTTYSKFQPANGILKGATSTYVTTAAASTDIINVWTGVCSSTTYLRGDGICAAPPGTGGGTVNSVGLSAPSVFAVSGTPVTSSGVLALTFATGQTANQVLASPNGTTGAVALRSLVAADIPTIPLATGVSGILGAGLGGTGEAGTVTGVLKGNGTGAHTAAVATDVIGLWSGSCTAGTFLQGNGVCSAAGTGSVTSVALTVPSGLTVTGSPVTTSGTLAIGGTLNVSAGGTGAATLTGPLKGNGTAAVGAAIASDIYGLWSGTCSSTTFLRGDGACAAAAGTTGANPSGLIGMVAVNGVATTFERSDSTHAIDPAIAPTWTGVHTFSVAGAGGASGSAAYFSSTRPQIGFNWTTGGTDAKKWVLQTVSNQFVIQTLNDAESVNKNIFDATRTGNVVSDITFGNATDTTTYNFLGVGALTAGGVIGNTATDSNGAFTTVPFYSSATTPGYAWNETGAAANARLWRAVVNGGVLRFRVTDDAGSTAKNWMDVVRTGGAVTTLDFGNTTDNPSYTFTGTGTLSAGGHVVVTGTAATLGLQTNTGGGLLSNAQNVIGLAMNTSGTDYGMVQANGADSWALAHGASTSGPGTQVLTWVKAGNVTINAPSSGIALQINGIAASANSMLDLIAGTNGAALMRMQDGQTGTRVWQLEVGNPTIGYFRIRDATAGVDRLTIGTAGGVIIGAPTGGDKGAGSINAQALYVNNTPVLTTASGGFNKIASGVFTTNTPGTINVNGGGIGSINFNSAGNITVLFTSGYFSTNAVCTVSGVNGANLLAKTQGSGIGTGGLNVTLTTTAGVQTDGSFSLICVGT